MIYLVFFHIDDHLKPYLMSIPNRIISLIQWKSSDAEFGDNSLVNRNVSEQWMILSISIALGLGLSIAGTYALFQIGIPISRWHILMLLFPLFLYPYIVSSKRFYYSLKTGLLHLLVIVFSIVICSTFKGLGGDGMATHQEAILALTSEWNPSKDPYFLEGEVMSERYAEVREAFWIGKGISRTFPYILSAIINKAVGIHEAGKSLHLIVMWMSFCAAMAFCERIFKRVRTRVLFSVSAALNPVIMYQFLSYWQDGLLAGIYTSLIFIALCWLLEPHRNSFVLGVASLCFLLSGSKLAGIGFSGITCLWIFAAQFLSRRLSFYWLVLTGVFVMLCIVGGGTLTGIWNFNEKTAGSIHDKIVIYKSEEINHGGDAYNQVKEYYNLNRWIVFFASAFSISRSVATEIELKAPFTTSWDEIRTYYYFFEDPRSGGYGVFYSAMVILAVALFIIHGRKLKRQALLVLCVIGMICTPLFFVPTYWARWIPQMWLMPLFLTIPAWIQSEDKSFGNPPVFSFSFVFSTRIVDWIAAIAILNGLLIAIPYFAGNCFGTWMLKQQLDVVDKLEQPVLYGHGSFNTNRKWLIDSGIDYEMTWEPEHWLQSYVQFYRTDTRVFMDENTLKMEYKPGISIEGRLDELKSITERWQYGQWLNDVWVDRRAENE